MQVRKRDVVPCTVEAVAVNDSAVLVEAEDTRKRIPGLWERSDRADLDEAEARSEERGDSDTIFVKAGGQTNTVWECEGREGGRGRVGG